MKRLHILILCLLTSITVLAYRVFILDASQPAVTEARVSTPKPNSTPKPRDVIAEPFGPCRDKRGQLEDAPEIAGLEPTVMTFSSDCRWLMVGNENGSLQVIDRETGRLLGENPGHALRVVRMVATPDDKYLFSSGQALGEILVISLPDARKVATIDTGKQSDHALAFDPKRRLLIAGGSQFLKGWYILPDAAGRLPGLEQPAFSVPVRRVVLSLAVSPDGKHIAAGGTGTLQLFEIGAGESLQVREIGYLDGYPPKEWVLGVAFSEDGSVVAAGTRKKNIGVWRVPTLEPIQQGYSNDARWNLFTDPWKVTVAPLRDYKGEDRSKLIFKLHDSTADRVYSAWSGSSLHNVTALRGEVIASGNSRWVSFFPMDSSGATLSIPSATGGARTMLLNFAAAPDVSVLAAKRRTAEISVIDLQTLKEVRQVESVAGPVSLRIAAESKLVAYSNDAEVGLVDPKTGEVRKVVRPKRGKEQQLINLGISTTPDESGIAAIFGDKLVEIRPDLKVTPIATLPLMGVGFIAPLRSRQAYLVAGPDKTIILGKGGIKMHLPIQVNIDGAAVLTPDEKILFAKFPDRICRYELSENAECKIVVQSKNDPHGSLDTDGAILVEGGRNKILRVLNAVDGEEIRRMEGHAAEIVYVKLLGSRVLSADATGELRIWEINDGHLALKARP
ncbi:MAG: WD40 repeat domain-containing protein [Rhodocyclaceae bacterium]